MDVLALTKSMNQLIESLDVVQTDDCSDDFLTVLNHLIQNATELSLKIQLNRAEDIEGNRRKKRRLTGTSSSSDDVRCVSAEIVTIEVDSDSDDSGQSDETLNIANIVTSSENAESAVQMHVLDPRTKIKRCAVNLKRVNMTGNSSARVNMTGNSPAVRELDRNFISPNDEATVKTTNAAQSKIENKKPTNQVSLTENENISNANSKPIRRNTYDDYLKRYQDVCCLQ